MTLCLSVFLLLTAIFLARLNDLLAVSMMFGIYSLVLATLFVLMDAADVSMTETVIGAGVSSVMLIAAVAATTRKEKLSGCHRRSLIALVAILVVGAAMVYGTLGLPHYGDPSAMPHQHVALRYINETPEEIGITNMVSSVLASYRGYDTLGEVTVIFCAAVGVLLLLGYHGDNGNDVKEEQGDAAPLESHMILRIIVKLLLPVILMFGLYIQFHGEISPGGGFQAGALIASAFYLYALVFGLKKARTVIPPVFLQVTAAMGVLIFAGTGLVCQLLGGDYLDYNLLHEDAVTGQHIGIGVIEFGVCLTVASVMLIFLFNFARRVGP